MASSRCRTAVRLAVALAALAAAAACSTTSSLSGANVAGGPDPGIYLPPGPGRDIMIRKCLGCHDLGGLDLFSNFYGRNDWHSLLQTMMTHGADINAVEIETITDYLVENFSRD